MIALLLFLALAAPFTAAIDITDAQGNMLVFNNNANPPMGQFVINNGANCAGLVCPNCNGSKYDVAFRDPVTGLEVIEIDFGWTSASTNGPNCGAGAMLTVSRTTPAGTPPTGYAFADPGKSWTVVVNSGAANPVICQFTNTFPTIDNTVPAPVFCAQYEWKFDALFPTYVGNIALAQANLRWGAKLNGVWVVNDLVNVGTNTYLAAENKILISVPNFAEYAVFVKVAPKESFVNSFNIMLVVALLLAMML